MKKIYIYYLAGYPVSSKVIGRISGQISFRYNPNHYKTLIIDLCVVGLPRSSTFVSNFDTLNQPKRIFGFPLGEPQIKVFFPVAVPLKRGEVKGCASKEK